MKKIICAALALAAASSAYANSYFLVVPIQGRAATQANIQVELAGASLPGGLVGTAYPGFDFNELLRVTGDSAFQPGKVSWSVASGTLPAGLRLDATGHLSGTPQEATNSSFTVKAAYKRKSGEQTYQLVTLNIVVALPASELPVAQVGATYRYDFNALTTVTGDPGYQPGDLVWAMDGAPAGLSLSATGVLSGTVGAFPGASERLTVTAAYRNKTGQRTYVLAQERDPYWAQTVALLRMDGAPGSTSFVDLKGGTYTNTGVSITDASSVFGQSGAFSGGRGKGLIGPEINLEGDFTLEAWVKPSSAMVSAPYSGFLGQWGQYAPHGSYLLGIQGGVIVFTYHPFSDVTPIVSGPTLRADAWVHVAVTRSGPVFRMFVNGRQVSTASSSAAGKTVPIPFAVGDYFNGQGTFGANGNGYQSFDGQIDEVRVTKGVSRYNSDFTPAKVPFPGR